MDDINSEENNSPQIGTPKEASIKSQNEPIVKTPTISINASIKSSPRQASPRQASPLITSPQQGSLGQASPGQASPRKASPRQASPAQASPSPASPRRSRPRQASPLRRMSNIDSPPKNISQSSPVKSEKSSVSSSFQGNDGGRPKSPSIRSGRDNETKASSEPKFPDSSVEKSQNFEENINETISQLQPQGKKISKYVDDLTDTVKELSECLENAQSPVINSNINKITNMSKILTNEANALRESIKHLSDDISRTKEALGVFKEEDVNFPYHLFLLELIINKIHMKCECFEFNYDNLVISASFLGKAPITLYDSSYGKIDNFNKLNVGKSIMFAMTYDKICSIKEFVIHLQITKRPPCSTCITRIAETFMDYSNEFATIREELCKKWTDEQPNDNILCTASTPLSKSMFYLSCCQNDQSDPIGIIEITTRMSFLGKEITTAFNATSKSQGTSLLMKDDHGMSLYSCQKVEMDRHGKILLDEDEFTKRDSPTSSRRTCSPVSQNSSIRDSYKRALVPQNFPKHQRDNAPYDEIFTKMNENELKIKVPKSSKIERTGKYEAIEDLCSCEGPLYNTGDQIQFELPRDGYQAKGQNTYTSNLKYSYRKCDGYPENKDKKIINITPSNCPAPVNIEKEIHPLKDVFILRIGKKLETKDKKTDLEIELVTPKAPSAKSAEMKQISQQSSTGKLDESNKSDKKKPKKAKSKSNLKKDKKNKKAKKLKTKK